MAYVVFLTVLLMALIYFDIPALNWFLKKSF
jgi:hypothetical protein